MHNHKDAILSKYGYNCIFWCLGAKNGLYWWRHSSWWWGGGLLQRTRWEEAEGAEIYSMLREAKVESMSWIACSGWGIISTKTCIGVSNLAWVCERIITITINFSLGRINCSPASRWAKLLWWSCWSSLGNFTIALNCQMYWRVQRIRLSDGGLDWGLGLWGWLGGGEEQGDGGLGRGLAQSWALGEQMRFSRVEPSGGGGGKQGLDMARCSSWHGGRWTGSPTMSSGLLERGMTGIIIVKGY